MIRKTLIASALVLCGTLGFTSAAKAEDFQMSGTVDGSCVFTATANGTLAPSGSPVTVLDSAATGGSAATATVNCNKAGTLTIAAPTFVGTDATGFVDTNATTTFSVEGTGASTISESAAGTPALNYGDTNLQINMAVDNGGVAIPAGTYTYSITLTAAAN